jgi:MFS family permease
MGTKENGAAEWRRHWTLPIAAGLGYSLGVIHIYTLGAFITPLQEEFGWSRAEASAGLTMTGFVSALAAFPIGLMVDRLGPRRVGVAGTILMGLGFALLSTATGSVANWLLLWGVLAIATFWVQTTVWTSAVASRFEQSRGLAFALTLSGASLAAAIFPSMATSFITELGWRNAFIALAALWSVLVLLVLLFFFRGAQDQRVKKDAAQEPPRILPGVTLGEGLRSLTFYRLLLAAFLFAFTALGLVVHFVPILTDSGADRAAAAGIAGLVGIFSIVGRLGMGALLDRFPARTVGALAYLIPIPACVLLLIDGANPVSQTAAAALIGLTVGAEVDVIAYLASRHFGLKNFGGLFGGLVAALSMGTAFGPLAAGAVFDANESYAPFLAATIVLMAASSLVLATLPRPPFAADAQS